jgi:hypothetical protein
VRFEGFIGSAYELPSLSVDAQRCVNLYLEKIESGSGKERVIAYLKSTPALVKLFDVGSGPIRCIHFDGLEKDDGSYFQKNRVFVVSSNEVYRLFLTDAGTWDVSLLGTIGSSSGYVSAASLEQDYGVTVFVDGTDENYVYHKTTTVTETFQTFTAAGYQPVARATQVRWLDGFLIFIVKDSNQFYVTTWGTISVDALSFASAEGDPDNIVAVITNHRDLWLLNERSTEIFANTGNADFPFERVQGGFIENGCMAAFSVAKADGTIFWLGRDSAGQGVVYAAKSANHQRISTHAIEYKIKSYADPSNAQGYCYQDAGHIFYVLSFDEATWCYDLSTGAWHERAFTNETTGLLERHRAGFHAFYSNNGAHILGDFETGALYTFSNDVYKDNGNTITRLRRSPHISNGLKNIFHRELKLDMQFGVGLDGGVLGSDPQVMMRFSDDGGRTWSSELSTSIGKIGQFKNDISFSRLGMTRDRVYEVKVTDPVNVVLLGAELEMEPANR